MMAVTKMARPGMVTQTFSEVIKEAMVDIMLHDRYSVITAKAMDIWAKSGRTQGYLKVGDSRPQHHLSKDSYAYAQNFVPMQYPVSIQHSVVSHVPQYIQSNMAPVQETRLLTLLISQAGQGMLPVAPAQQQPLN